MSRSPYHAEQPPPLRAPAEVALAVGWTVAAQFWRAHHPHPLFPRQCAACGTNVPCRMWSFADGLLREALDELAADGQARAYDGGARTANAVGIALGVGGTTATNAAWVGWNASGAAATGIRGGEQTGFSAGADDALSEAPTQVLPVVGHGRGKASVPVLVPPMRHERRRRPGPGVVPPPAGSAPAAEVVSEPPAVRIFPPIEELATGRPQRPAGSTRRQRAQRRVLEVFPPEPVQPQAKGGAGEQRHSERQRQQSAGARHNLPTAHDPRRKR